MSVKNYLELILRDGRKILERTAGVTYGEWGEDDMLRDAVCMRLLVLSENVKAYSAKRKNLSIVHPEIPWKDIARLRDKMAHHYDAVDYDIIWSIVEEDIEPLLNAVKQLQMENDPEQS